jgi:hypothetical protein
MNDPALFLSVQFMNCLLQYDLHPFQNMSSDYLICLLRRGRYKVMLVDDNY